MGGNGAVSDVLNDRTKRPDDRQWVVLILLYQRHLVQYYYSSETVLVCRILRREDFRGPTIIADRHANIRVIDRKY